MAKCFIEYIPAENAWVPIEAGWLSLYQLPMGIRLHEGTRLLVMICWRQCIRDAKAQGKKGICILCAEGRKREFLADPKFLTYKGFHVADISDCGINLMYLPLAENADQPKFKDCARHPASQRNGFCPLLHRPVSLSPIIGCRRCRRRRRNTVSRFKAIHITDKEAAQNVPAPVTTYALFRDGQFLTQSIQSDKKFLALAGLQN